jgi:hypothetical protein
LETLWSSAEFGWVVALTDVRELPDVSDDEVRSAAGFSRVQMSMPVPADRRPAVHELLGLARRLPTATPVNSLEQLDPLAPLSVWAVAERRNEQSLLRRSLVSGAVVSCDLCGDDLPATFVRAAHIKPRALCSDDERRDVNNVLVACVLCDVAFERGWISLDEGQTIVVSASMPVTEALQQRLTRLVGREVARC